MEENSFIVDVDEFDNLLSELADAHQKLTDYGVGKEHWSLSGRIESALGWYKVDTIMPKDGDFILIYSNKTVDFTWFTETRYKRGFIKFTHWKPLPHPPIDD